MRRVTIAVCVVCALACADEPKTAAPKPIDLSHTSGLRTPPVPLVEGKAAVITVGGKLGDKEKLKLTIDTNSFTFDEAGQVKGATLVAPRSIDCTATFVKMVKVKPKTVNPPRPDIPRPLYRIEGKDLKSRLSLVGPGEENPNPRLLVHDAKGNVTHFIDLVKYEVDTTPCHPGCFPAGTPVVTPKGPRPVEAVRVGDEVTTVDAEGVAGTAKVQSVFVTRNRLLKVETDGGTLFTTPTQPLCRVDGRIVATEELKAGDRVYTWKDGKRVAVRVTAVGPSGRTEKVFNLVLGDNQVFIAGGFLARSKPPE